MDNLSDTPLEFDLNKLLEPPEVRNYLAYEPKIGSLPFGQVSWQTFEKLSARLLEATAVGRLVQAFVYGGPGQAQYGIDVVALTSGSSKQTVMQCKHVQKVNRGQLREWVAMFISKKKLGDADRYILCLLYPIENDNNLVEEWSAQVELLEKEGVYAELWSENKLNALLRDQPVLVTEFFGDKIASNFCTSVPVPDKRDASKPLLEQYRKWVIDANDHFFVPGIKRKIPLAHLLPMSLQPRELETDTIEDAATALERYHKGIKRPIYRGEFDAIWTARFKRLAVVVAGPGLGKSTLIRQLAVQYAMDGYFVLSVALQPIAAAMTDGGVFTDLLFNHALNTSPLRLSKSASFAGLQLVILADGLDECGVEHSKVAKQLNDFALGHPTIRLVVTTRPIGYTTGELSDWDHYTLLAPRKEEGTRNLAKLVRSLQDHSASEMDKLNTSSSSGGTFHPSDAIAISPQLLCMSASLVCRRQALASTRLGLYSQLTSLFKRPPEGKADTYDTILNIVGWKVLNKPLILFNELVDQTTKFLKPLLEKPPLVLKEEVRQAIAHWERVGLVERVFHGEMELLTFIHKTFCEFTASRLLAEYPEDLTEEIIDSPDKKEVVDFAVGQGLADHLIALFLKRHIEGQPAQLPSALALLGQQEIAVSEKSARKLLVLSWKAVEEGCAEKFIIGLSLAELGGRAFHFVKTIAEVNCQASQPHVRLIAWAIVVNDPGRFKYADLFGVLTDLLSSIAPFDVIDLFNKRDRSDQKLVQIVALAVIKIEPIETVKTVADWVFQHNSLRTISFMIDVNRILRARNMEEIPFPFGNETEKKSAPYATLTPIGPTFIDGGIQACREISEAFVPESSLVKVAPVVESSLIEFAALMRAAGYDEVPVSDFYAWLEPHDVQAAQATMQAVAMLTSLNLEKLALDAQVIQHRINAGLETSILRILPSVDVGIPRWHMAPSVPLNREAVMRGLAHPSFWIAKLASCIFEYLPISKEQLEVLLDTANGNAIAYIIQLASKNCKEDMIPMLNKRLCRSPLGDVSPIFHLFCQLPMPVSQSMLNKAEICVCSDDQNTAQAAADLLHHWAEKGVPVDLEVVTKAIEHWGGDDGMNSLMISPIGALISLRETLKVTSRNLGQDT
ncbi:restriction endonuclease [Janthinobacterium sp. BJB304]|uniref:restriction endonuclease n=1 Tax=Janthinobacterium sp. BJB304 TaxID=1572871 RepID=UPI000C0D3713|nr:restriction endonuclease [Janthinobacterium sp. BJB304]PHV39195.1 hypothetical protein CSQ95_10780 [Janthinobacterium sp. BJB304]